MRATLVSGVLGLVIGGCSMEVAPPQDEAEGPVSSVEQAVSAYTEELLLQDGRWSILEGFASESGEGYQLALPHLPQSFFSWPSGGGYSVLKNNEEFPLMFIGRVRYGCNPSTGSTEYLVFGSALSSATVVGPHATKLLPLRCVPGFSDFVVTFRPAAPTGAVPFHDAFAVEGGPTNFFPESAMRLSPRTPIARSNTINIAGKANLYIRYSHSHPESPSAILRVGIQNYDAGGNTAQVFSNVAFPVTPTSDYFDQWSVIALKLNAGSAQNIYARLEMVGGSETIYLDAAWAR